MSTSSTWYRVEPLAGVWENPTPAHERRSRYTFKASFADSLNLLMREIEKLDPHRTWGETDVVLSVACRPGDLRRDGGIRADARAFDHPGVRVSFTTKDLGPLSYGTDCCEQWQHNVRSIALGLEALRAVDRFGISNGSQQYTGFKALPAGRAMPASHMTATDARHLIARLANPNAGEDAIATAEAALTGDRAAASGVLRRAMALSHPDRRNGDRVLWNQLEEAVTALGWSL